MKVVHCFSAEESRQAEATIGECQCVINALWFFIITVVPIKINELLLIIEIRLVD